MCKLTICILIFYFLSKANTHKLDVNVMNIPDTILKSDSISFDIEIKNRTDIALTYRIGSYKCLFNGKDTLNLACEPTFLDVSMYSDSVKIIKDSFFVKECYDTLVSINNSKSLDSLNNIDSTTLSKKEKLLIEIKSLELVKSGSKKIFIDRAIKAGTYKLLVRLSFQDLAACNLSCLSWMTFTRPIEIK
jgi:hypothetical protein